LKSISSKSNTPSEAEAERNSRSICSSFSFAS
jgi:hypothetical protein